MEKRETIFYKMGNSIINIFDLLKKLFMSLTIFFAELYQKVDRVLEKVFDATIKFFNRHLLLIVLIFLTIGSLIIRLSFYEFTSGDANAFLIGWVQHIRDNGIVGSLKVNPPTFDYPIAYLLLLMPFSYLPVNNLMVVKIVSILFDYLLAFGVYLVVKQFIKSKAILLVTYLAIIFAPTVVINSSIWAQSDQIYVSLVVFCIYFLLKSKNKTAMFILGIALSIKIQTTFIFPALALLWLNKKITLRQMSFMLVAVFILFIPSLSVGYPLIELLGKFASLTGKYKNSNYGAANIYAFIGNMEHAFTPQLNTNSANMIIAACFILFAVFVFYYKKIKISPHNTIYLMTFFAIFVPFVLPHMHDRYFYMADIMIIIYVIINKRRYYLAGMMITSSLLTYTHFLTGRYVFIFLGEDCVRLAALLNFAIIIFLINDIKHLEKNDKFVTVDA